jgi:hypothetical protein
MTAPTQYTKSLKHLAYLCLHLVFLTFIFQFYSNTAVGFCDKERKMVEEHYKSFQLPFHGWIRYVYTSRHKLYNKGVASEGACYWILPMLNYFQ